jgi:hypothetical protein
MSHIIQAFPRNSWLTPSVQPVRISYIFMIVLSFLRVIFIVVGCTLGVFAFLALGLESLFFGLVYLNHPVNFFSKRININQSWMYV